MGKRIDAFRGRLTAGKTTTGTFLKTPSSIVCEVIGLSKLDVVVIDVEHAPFGRLEVDRCIGALRAADMPSLVRVASDSTHDIRAALDSGASGIVVPHVTGVEQADAIVRATRFGEGGRGYAGSPRAAGYTTRSMKEHLSYSSEHTTVVAQIEDIAALENVARIAAVDGIDALFVGRVDLAVAMQKGVSDKDVIATIEDVCAAASEVGTTVGLFTPDFDEIAGWKDKGATLFLLGSDHAFLLNGANALADLIP